MGQDEKKETIEDTLARLKSNSNGLTQEEASERLKKFGPNVIAEKK